MYAINTANRFTTIEYYYRYRDCFSNQAQTGGWVQLNFHKIPRLDSHIHCTSNLILTPILVEMFSSKSEIE